MGRKNKVLMIPVGHIIKWDTSETSGPVHCVQWSGMGQRNGSRIPSGVSKTHDPVLIGYMARYYWDTWPDTHGIHARYSCDDTRYSCDTWPGTSVIHTRYWLDHGPILVGHMVLIETFRIIGRAHPLWYSNRWILGYNKRYVYDTIRYNLPCVWAPKYNGA
jgi:hypothetical protein